MTDNADAPDDKKSFAEHPLYRAALERLAHGDVEEGIARLNELIELYPEEKELQDLVVRWQLMSMFAASGPPPVERSAPAPFLRNALLILLVVTLLVVGVAVFAAAFQNFVIPPRATAEAQATLQSLKQNAQDRLTAGDWQGAQESCQELLNLVHGDVWAQDCIQRSQEQAELDRLYADALTYEQQGDWQAALDRFHQIEARSPGFRDVAQRIAAAEKELAMEAGLQEAQARLRAGDWQASASQLAQIRAENPDFRRKEVEDLLFQAYTQLARQQIGQANGDPNILRQALGSMDQALSLQPTNQDLLRERSLAQGFVLGFEAYARGDWASAVGYWEQVQATQADYQNGILKSTLAQTYPQAAAQLIDQAYGDAAMLRQAVGYLDHALASQPTNQSLIDSRQLAAEYLAGADAAALEHWDQAIAHWGPIFARQPDYQHGVLEDRLRQACANSPAADTALCPP